MIVRNSLPTQPIEELQAEITTRDLTAAAVTQTTQVFLGYECLLLGGFIEVLEGGFGGNGATAVTASLGTVGGVTTAFCGTANLFLPGLSYSATGLTQPQFCRDGFTWTVSSDVNVNTLDHGRAIFHLFIQRVR